jgi:GT2 family glycosyltransferase
MTASVCFITVNYHDAPTSERFLKSLADVKGSDTARVIIVNNGHLPDDRAVLEGAVARFPGRIEVLDAGSNLFYWRAAALALQRPALREFDWIIVCNNDITFPDPDFLEILRGLDPMTHPVVAPHMIAEQTGEPQNPFQRTGLSRAEMVKWRLYFSHYYVARALLWLKGLSRREREEARQAGGGEETIYAPHGAFMIFSRRFFEAGGELDTGFTMYGEESSIGATARRLGIPVLYAPRLRVIHAEHANANIGAGLSRAKYRRQREAFAYCYRKYGDLLMDGGS